MSILRCLVEYKLICVFEGDFHLRIFRVRSQNTDKTGFDYNVGSHAKNSVALEHK